MEQTKDYLSMRRQKGMNQSEFWKQVFVTQSGGSRYENDRRVPGPVAELVRLQHELDIDTALITSDNAHLIRAILSGDLDAAAIQASANRCRDLMAHLSGAALDLAELSSNVGQLLGERHGQ